MTDRPGRTPHRTLVPDEALRTESNGRVLLGGTPFRAMRLSASGARRVRSWFAGTSEPTGDAEEALAARLVHAGLAHPRPAPASIACHVVLPFRGPLDELETTLSPLRRSGAASITVVDDGSSPPLPDIHGVTVLRHPRSAGPGAARNTGWRHVQRCVAQNDTSDGRDLIAFVDGGVTVPVRSAGDASWLEQLMGHLADDAVAAAAPRVSSTPGARLIERYEALFSPLDLGPTPSLVGPGHLVTYVPTACLVVRLADLVAVSGFDEALRYGEDVDLVWRLAAEKQVRYDPSIVVHHPPRPNLRSFAEQRYRYATAAAALDHRHESASAPWQTSSVGLAAVAATSLGRPLLGALIGFGPTKLVADTLASTATPTATSVRLLAASHRWNLRSFAECAGRTWAPIALGAAFAPGVPRSFRRTAAGWMLGGWMRRLTSTRSLPLLALGVVDDLAYGAGACAGAIRHRSLRSLVPRISRWG